MSSKIEVTCFTDLKGSTSLTEELGHERYLPHVREYLRVGRLLAQATGGHYVKDIGDAHMVTFEFLEGAISFASQLQQYYSDQPCLERPPLQVRVGMYLGPVVPAGPDVFGSGVNRAARVEGQAEPRQVLVNAEMVNALRRAWGPAKVDRYFVSLGEFELRGIPDPPRQTLFSFDWSLYAQDEPARSLGGLIYTHLQNARVEASNLALGDLTKSGVVIWPVVPRDVVTAIHRGQAEVIRLLVLLGWTVQVLIADCGAQENFDRRYCSAFSGMLRSYAASRDIRNADVLCMSELYETDYQDYDHIQRIFRGITSDLSLRDLLSINNKSYTDTVKEEIQASKTLDCLRPALSSAAVLHMAKASRQKAIVIAGYDEVIQWERTFDVPSARAQLGALMNPVYKCDRDHQSRQRRSWPIWPSYQALVRDMDGTNLAWWTFHMHAYIPAFPADAVEIAGHPLSPASWADELQTPPGLAQEDLARHVWPLLDQSRT